MAIWEDPRIPRQGWECLGVEHIPGDEEPQTCEVCQVAIIRWIHHMRHDEWPVEYDAGCVCAGQMEQSPAAAKEREQSANSRERRRKGWARRKWKLTANGNHTLKIDGFHITLFTRNGSFHAVIMRLSDERQWWSKRHYASIEAVRAASFEAFEHVKSRDVD